MQKYVPSVLIKREEEKDMPKTSQRSPGHDRGTDRNRRVSNALSPIFYLFLAPSGKLYLKVQQLLGHGETLDATPHPIVGKRRPGPKNPTYGIPASEWPTIVQHVLEQKKPLRTVAAAYGVSHETIRRIILHVQKQRGQHQA